jgi:hypothetical protein
MAAFLQSCATTAVTPTTPTAPDNQQAPGELAQASQQVELGRVVDQPLSLIASDLTNALTQVMANNENSDKVKVPPVNSKFGVAVKQALTSRGIEVVNVNFIKGRDVVRTGTAPMDNPDTQTYTVYLGEVSITRAYSIENNKVTPRSSLYIGGFNAGNILLDDRIFLPEKARMKATIGDTYLCTPEGKGKGTDGWVCSEERAGKQWIDARLHASLIEKGMPVVLVDWEDLMSKPDATILTNVQIFNDLTASLPKGTLYLCTPEGKGAGTDGWLCRAGQSGKQWVSIQNRNRFVQQGVLEAPIAWDSLMAMSNVEWVPE